MIRLRSAHNSLFSLFLPFGGQKSKLCWGPFSGETSVNLYLLSWAECFISVKGLVK